MQEIHSFDERALTFSEKDTLKLDDAATALATHDNLLITIIGTGCKNFVYQEGKLSEESDYEHDIHVSSTEEQSKLVMSTDGKRLIVASDSGPVRVLRYPECEPITVAKLHSQGVNDLDIAKDGSIVASSARDNCSYLWNTETGESVQLLQPLYKDQNRTSIKAVRFSPIDSNILFAVESNPRKGGSWLSIWRKGNDMKTPWKCHSHVLALREGVSTFSVSPNGKHIAIASVEGHVALLTWNGSSFRKNWNTEDRVSLFTPAKPSHALPVTSLCFTHSSEYVLTASADWTVAAWSVRKRTNFKRIRTVFKRFTWLIVAVIAIFIALINAEGDPVGLGLERMAAIKKAGLQVEISCMASPMCKQSRDTFDRLKHRAAKEASHKITQVIELCELDEPVESAEEEIALKDIILYRVGKPTCRKSREAFNKVSQWKVKLESYYREHGPTFWEYLKNILSKSGDADQLPDAGIRVNAFDSEANTAKTNIGSGSGEGIESSAILAEADGIKAKEQSIPQPNPIVVEPQVEDALPKITEIEASDDDDLKPDMTEVSDEKLINRGTEQSSTESLSDVETLEVKSSESNMEKESGGGVGSPEIDDNRSATLNNVETLDSESSESVMTKESSDMRSSPETKNKSSASLSVDEVLEVKSSEEDIAKNLPSDGEALSESESKSDSAKSDTVPVISSSSAIPTDDRDVQKDGPSEQAGMQSGPNVIEESNAKRSWKDPAVSTFDDNLPLKHNEIHTMYDDYTEKSAIDAADELSKNVKTGTSPKPQLIEKDTQDDTEKDQVIATGGVDEHSEGIDRDPGILKKAETAGFSVCARPRIPFSLS